MSAAVMPPQTGDPAQPQPAAAAQSSALALTTNMTASSLTSGGNSCLDEQIERLKRCEYLREGEVKALCLRAREILVDESNVQRVDAPVTVSLQYYVKSVFCMEFYKAGLRTGSKYVVSLFSSTLFSLSNFENSDLARYAETFMVNSTISLNSSKSEVNVRTKTIYSWATLSIEDITV